MGLTTVTVTFFDEVEDCAKAVPIDAKNVAANSAANIRRFMNTPKSKRKVLNRTVNI